jgi:xylulokinase
MTAPYVIGIDLGTQSTKSSIIDKDGNVVGEASQEVELHYPRTNWVEQDPNEFYLSALNTVREAVLKSKISPKDVHGIGLDSQMASTIRIDEDWKPLDRMECYLDTRYQVHRDQIMEENSDYILDKNGFYPYVGPRLMWWKEEHPDEYERTCKVVMLNAYVGGCMAGLKADQAYIDPTYIGTTGLSDIRKFSWSSDLADLMDIGLDKLPRIVQPWDIIGELTPEAADACGLVPGIPIVAGVGDAVAGWIGVGAVEPGIVVDTSGTAHHLALCVDNYQPDIENKVLTHFPSAIPGQWYSFGYTAGTGRSHTWFIDEFCQNGDMKSKGVKHRDYAQLDKLAREIPPGSEGLIFIPHLGGRMCPYAPNIRGLWIGFTWKHNRAHFYRALLESIAYEYFTYINVASSLYPDTSFSRVIMIGGGAKSELWTQIKADVLGIPHAATINRQDFAPLGSAIIAGYAVGLFNDIADTARGIASTSRDVYPDETNRGMYSGYAKFYDQVFAELSPTFDKLSRLAEDSRLA